MCSIAAAICLNTHAKILSMLVVIAWARDQARSASHRGCRRGHQGLDGSPSDARDVEGCTLMRQFGQLEASVMQRLWDWDRPAAVREVLEDLRGDRNIAYTTVMTVMDNLFQKGILERELHGRAYLYRPLRSREQHTAELMEQVLSSGGDSGATLLHFVERMPSQEVRQLRAVLDQITPTNKKSPT